MQAGISSAPVRPAAPAPFALIAGNDFSTLPAGAEVALSHTGPRPEPLALSCGHAKSRGPHHGYHDVMTARVDRIRICFERQINRDARAARRTAAMRLALLQGSLRRALTDRRGTGFNRRDPMRLFADRPYLDEAITRLFG